MPISDAELLDLRLRYESAYDAYRSGVDALAAVGRRGERPSPELLENESRALSELNEARERYREALLQLGLLVGEPPP